MSFFEGVQQRRFERAAKQFLRKHYTPDSLAILHDDEKFQAFCDECLSAHGMEGPLSDVINKLIQSFIDDPEKWIKIIQLIITMFA
jgi:hypothetical protein